MKKKLLSYSIVNVILSEENGRIYGYCIMPLINKTYFKKMWFLKDTSEYNNLLCCPKCGSLSHSASRCDRDYTYITLDSVQELNEEYSSYVKKEELYIKTHKD
jgi:hypothetical protein